jgi:hypothetical protein
MSRAYHCCHCAPDDGDYREPCPDCDHYRRMDSSPQDVIFCLFLALAIGGVCIWGMLRLAFWLLVP